MTDEDTQEIPTRPRQEISPGSWISFGVFLLLLAALVADVLAYQRHRLGPLLLLQLLAAGAICVLIGLTRKAP